MLTLPAPLDLLKTTERKEGHTIPKRFELWPGHWGIYGWSTEWDFKRERASDPEKNK